MRVELADKVRKRVPKSALAAYDDIQARAMEAFAEHDPIRREYMLAFVLSFWVLTEYDRRRLQLSKWARGYLYHFSVGCGKRLSPEEMEDAERFLASIGQETATDTRQD